MIENKTKQKTPVGFNAEHVIPLFSKPLYFGWWNNNDKAAIYSRKYWVKHEHKTHRYIAYDIPITDCINYSSYCSEPLSKY